MILTCGQYVGTHPRKIVDHFRFLYKKISKHLLNFYLDPSTFTLSINLSLESIAYYSLCNYRLYGAMLTFCAVNVTSFPIN